MSFYVGDPGGAYTAAAAGQQGFAYGAFQQQVGQQGAATLTYNPAKQAAGMQSVQGQAFQIQNPAQYQQLAQSQQMMQMMQGQQRQAMMMQQMTPANQAAAGATNGQTHAQVQQQGYGAIGTPIIRQASMTSPMTSLQGMRAQVAPQQAQPGFRLQPTQGMQQVQMHQLAAPQVQYVQPVNAQAYQQVLAQQQAVRMQPTLAAGHRAVATPIWTTAPRTAGGLPYRNPNQGPKPIKATEIKSYLYAWCTQQKKLKPEYLYETIGKSPKIRYKCTLSIPGLDYKASEEARSKRDAQTNAAWNFCDEMVRTGFMKKKDLPPRLNMPDDLEKGVGGGKGETGEDEYGGWTIDNSRQRLNRFCMAERISCDFENNVVQTNNGNMVNKMTTSRLELRFKRAQDPLIIETRSSNKKQANANCAVLAVRELYKRGFIEKFGTRTENYDDEQDGCLDGRAGMKRKFEEPLDFDENGNWTLETARAKLQDFFAINGKDLVFKEQESGTLQDRQYLFSCQIEVKSEVVEASATAPNKKSAQKKCALEMVVKLYKLKMIEGNLGKRIKPRHGPGLIKRTKYNEGSVVHGGPKVMPSIRLYNSAWEMNRTTPYDDRHIKFKLDQIDLQKDIKLFHGQSLEAVEDILKAYCDKIEGKVKGEVKNEPLGKLRIMEISRIGSNPKATMLRDESVLRIAVVYHEKPTLLDMQTIYGALAEGFALFKSEKIKIELGEMSIRQAFIQVKSRSLNENVKDTSEIHLMFTANEEIKEADPDQAETLRISTSENLIQLRQSRFFQQNAGGTFNCIAVAKILKSIISRDPSWFHMSEWICEVLSYAAMASYDQPITAGDGLKRVFSVLSSGVALTGIKDPTNETQNIFESFTKQEKEDITYLAQRALRLISFQKIHEVLGIDEISDLPRDSSIGEEKNGEDIKEEV